MSQIAEPVIAGLEVVEHFGEVREVLARLILPPAAVARSLTRRAELLSLSSECHTACLRLEDFRFPGAPFRSDVVQALRGLSRSVDLISSALSCDLSHRSRPDLYLSAVASARASLRFAASL